MSERVLTQQQEDLIVEEQQDNPEEQQSIEDVFIPPAINDIIDELEIDDINKGRLIQAISVVEQYSGPIPHPNIIKEYEKLSPGATDRILTMAEKEATHRHNMDEKFHKTDSRDSLLGIISAFLLTGALIVGGIVVILKVPQLGGTITGLLMTGGGAATILTTFIKGTKATWKLPRE